MSEQPETSADAVASDQRVCHFPLEYDPESGKFTECGEELPSGAGGRPAEYCGKAHVDPDGIRRRHVRTAAFQRRQQLKAKAAGGADAPRREKAAARPVTSARASLAELLAEVEMVTSSHRDQLAAIVGQV